MQWWFSNLNFIQKPLWLYQSGAKGTDCDCSGSKHRKSHASNAAATWGIKASHKHRTP